MYHGLINKIATIVALTSVVTSLNSNISTDLTTYEEPDVISMLKEEVRFTQHWDEGCSDHTIQLTQYEAYLIMSIASSEALNQGELGMLYVMETIINRVNSPLFPNSVYEVIAQPGQFSSFTTGAYLNAKITPEVHMALAKLESNNGLDSNLVAFERKGSGSLLGFFDFYMEYKDHVFYTSNS